MSVELDRHKRLSVVFVPVHRQHTHKNKVFPHLLQVCKLHLYTHTSNMLAASSCPPCPLNLKCIDIHAALGMGRGVEARAKEHFMLTTEGHEAVLGWLFNC